MMDRLPEKIKIAYRENESLNLGGYFRYITEDMQKQFISILENYSKWEGGIPFAVSAFGEILSYTEDEFIMLYDLPLDKSTVLLEGFDYFPTFIIDKGVCNDFLKIPLYLQAQKKLGILQDTDCYTFEPIPALGGDLSADHIGIGNTVVYLSITVQLLSRGGEM